MEQRSKGKAIGLSIATLALGIASFSPYIGWILGIVSLVLAGKGKKECEEVGFTKGMITGGKIAAIIGMIFSIIITIVVIVLAAAGAAMTYYY